MSGCKKDALPGDDERKDLIRFSGVDTRAVITNGSQITQFAVFAEQNLGPDDTPEALQWVSLLKDERVYRDDSGDFTYDNKRYWIPERTFFFFGVHPYGASVTREQNSDAKTFKYTLDIAVPTNAATDYMAAQKTVPVGLAPKVYPVVDMSFTHLLSKVAFKIMKSSEYNADDTFTVTQVGLSGISARATFIAEHGPNTYSEKLTVIPENRQVRRQGLNEVITTSGVNVLGDDDGLLLVPQEFAGGQVKLSVNYTYKGAGDTENTYLTLEVPIPADKVSKWESGKSYVYTLTLMIDHNIYISTPTVSDWGTAQPGGTIIIQ